MRLDYYTKDDKAKTSKEVAERLANIEHLTFRSDKQVGSIGNPQRGRSVFTRTIDLTFAMIRKYAPPIHWLGALVSALTLFCYIRLVALTAHLRTIGSTQWPDISAGSVVALWHKDAPSLVTAFAIRRPKVPCWIMISSDSRGDCLAL
ncbi:MAG TPA: hypothetical protein VLE19_15190, partial [Pyrinomonadaceae bacterium]|nr:hypothetical protein [Pyrinomonadaceae bacterium]